MINVKNLSKRYTNIYAVDNISFNVEDGEILGFLGPNGAGKSTTMRILTCFMPATSGTATIGGFDVFKDSLKARQIIGYLPENVPLYTEMRVTEYLLFRSKLKKVARSDRKKRINDSMEQCGIDNVQNQIIGTLSKGYRQRVGLADSLVHNPKILILDEPTIGLDPNQIRQVRQIIKGLGEKRTVLLSTHILPEVEMLCGRVVIINKGKIAASDTPGNLSDQVRAGGNLSLEIKGDSKLVIDAISKIDNVAHVAEKNKIENSGQNSVSVYSVESKKNMDVREQVFNAVVKNNFTLLEMKKDAVSLEEVFHHITTNEDAGIKG